MTSENYLFRVEGSELQPVEMITVPSMMGYFRVSDEERFMRVATEVAMRLKRRLAEQSSRTVVIAIWYASGVPVAYFKLDFIVGVPAITRLGEVLSETVEPECLEVNGSWVAYLANLADLHCEAERANRRYQVALASIEKLKSVNEDLSFQNRRLSSTRESLDENVVPMVRFKGQRSIVG